MAKIQKKHVSSEGWEGVAHWYTGWAGAGGSVYHRKLAIPAVMGLMNPREGQHILDMGCGPGALAQHICRRGAWYTGIDCSRKLLHFARRHNGGDRTRFLSGDATALQGHPELDEGSFDGVVFLLSLQDIHPLEGAIGSAAWALRPGGQLVIFMTHPCFRVPRQSGWGWDAQRKLHYRRVDRYLSALEVPMQPHERGRGTTRSYHRPLSQYFREIVQRRLVVDAFEEYAIPGEISRKFSGNADNRDIPLFLAVRARKY